MTEIMPSLQNLINLSYDPAGKAGGLFQPVADLFGWNVCFNVYV